MSRPAVRPSLLAQRSAPHWLAGLTAALAMTPPGAPARAEDMPPADAPVQAVAVLLRSDASRETPFETAPNGLAVERLSKTVSVRDLAERVITTVRRRRELLQATPLTVSSIPGEGLRSRQIRRLADLDGAVPGLSISRLGTANSIQRALRGVTQRDLVSSSDSGVGLFVDGINVPRAQGSDILLHDVEQVEVTRGPRGALFGRNTIGGTISVRSRPPVLDTAASAELRVGRFDQLDSRFVLNVPLHPEKAAARLSIATNYDDGFQSNVITGERFANDRYLGGRLQFLVFPTDELELLLSVEHSRQDRRPQLGKCKVSGRPDPGLELAVARISLREACAQNASRPDLAAASDLTFAVDDLRTTAYTARATYDLSARVTVKSISSARFQDNDIRQDLDGGPRNLAQPLIDAGGTEQRAFSQEFQLTGRTADGRLEYVAGLYAFGERSEEGTIGGMLSAVPGIRLFSPAFEGRLRAESLSLAAWGQLSYAITDRLSVSAGLRRTAERKAIRKRDTAIAPSVRGPAGTGLFEFQRSARFDNYSPNVSLAYQVRPGQLLYASYAEGFRSGGFNGRTDFANQDRVTLAPEELTSYEIGFKSVLLDGRLSVNGALYHGVYDQIQRALPALRGIGQAVVVRNAAEATLQGAEFELTLDATPSLRIDSTLSLFKGRYTDIDATGTGLSDRARKRLGDAALLGQPDHLLRLGATYGFDLLDWGRVSARADWTQRGARANDVTDSRSIRSPRHGLLDARIALNLRGDATEIAIFGTNVTDRRYVEGGIDFSESLGIASRIFGPPRRFGVELRHSF